MEKQQNLFKGEYMEELLRSYFLELGYYVVRSVKYKYESHDITDVDLYLYGRSSSLTRQRINVDIKNKKSPQAFERILWANGVRELLNFDSCIVATTDERPVIHSYGKLHNTIIMDGAFLRKLRSNQKLERITEEELLIELSTGKSYKTFGNKDWKFIYELSKSRLLAEQDFAGFNSNLSILSYFIEKFLTDEQKKAIALRMVYLTLSHLLIIIDYIIKDVAFLDQGEKEKKLSDGFKFGNLGKGGADRIIDMAIKISGNTSARSFLNELDNSSIAILRDFFSKNDNTKNLFAWARDLEGFAFRKSVPAPSVIDTNVKGIIGVFLDYFSIDRKNFFDHLIPSIKV